MPSDFRDPRGDALNGKLESESNVDQNGGASGDQDHASSGPADKNAIRIMGLSKKFAGPDGDIIALSDVGLDVADGEFLSIVGPSGCGKTTLLRILAGLETPDAGEVVFADQEDPDDQPLQSMVFQEQGVFPWLNVLDNAAYGLTVRKIDKRERHRRAREFLQMLGLSDFEQAWPSQLSGGMRQRVNLARAFVNDPAILLMDEPLGALDEQTKMLVQDDLLRLWEGTGKTVLFITHSLDEAIVLSDRVAVMSNRPGRIKTIIDIDLDRPRNALELRNNVRFLELRRLAWDALREEVVALHSAGAPGADT